ncbi:ATP-binding cassette domain-containing protein [Rhodoglobus vestalii]|uniref:ATP-binding cassette domain-containing protein n=1 Tax=Rhodoglobus vestalii TaxID=193384 RepID=UPI00114FF59E|nr:ATP-binding cassette domain-containing protein [Rhodoglobus vestalii]
MHFVVHVGEIVGVGGVMGSGRSRLLETVAGARKPESGKVLVDGVELRSGDIASARDAGMSFVPEDRDRQGLIGRHSIERNIRLNAYRSFQFPRVDLDRKIADGMSAALRIKPSHSGVRVEILSGGNAQKVIFGRELSREPLVFVLDEPTRGVDIAARADTYDLIRSRVEQGAAILLASSDIQELATLCDRVIVLFEGSLVGELESDSIDEEGIILLASGAAQRPSAGDEAIEQ